jgi:predicted metal-binding integral membrane protein DUF2182
MPLRRFVWTHPEWWVWVLCAGAWSVLLFRAPHPPAHHVVPRISVVEWSAMVLAMMLPLVFTHLRATAARSLWKRRHRAMTGFLCGYAGAWIGAGSLLAVIVNGSSWLAAAPALAVAAFVLASAWELTAVKRRALSACHAMLPLSPSGWRADFDTLRYGWYVGSRCVVVCGLSMIACALAGHSRVVMVALSAVLYGSRELSPSAGTNAAAVAGVAAAVALMNG